MRKLITLMFLTVGLIPADAIGQEVVEQEVVEPFLVVFSMEGHLNLSPPPPRSADDEIVVTAHRVAGSPQDNRPEPSFIAGQVMNPEELSGGGTRREVWIPFSRPFEGARFELGGITIKDRGEGNGPNAPGLHAYGFRLIFSSPDPS